MQGGMSRSSKLPRQMRCHTSAMLYDSSGRAHFDLLSHQQPLSDGPPLRHQPRQA